MFCAVANQWLYAPAVPLLVPTVKDGRPTRLTQSAVLLAGPISSRTLVCAVAGMLLSLTKLTVMDKAPEESWRTLVLSMAMLVRKRYLLAAASKR